MSAARVLAVHRQEHVPETGSSRCSCRQWEGPFTIIDDERSFAEHLLDALEREGFMVVYLARPESRWRSFIHGAGRTFSFGLLR